MHNPSRRDALRLGTAAAAAGFAAPFAGLVGASPADTKTPAAAAKPAEPAPAKVRPRAVAAVATVFFPNSHADVILTKILEGWKHDGGPGPALTLAGVYIEQFPDRDMGRALLRKHGVPLFDNIADAVTAGGKGGIAVDGVLCIGEHGTYPENAIGQQLYPRRKFFDAVADTFEKRGRVVPMFNDKHLGPVWADAKAMFDRAAKLEIPYMAGSSLPLTYRDPHLEIPMGAELTSAVVVGYGGLERYGFHALECLQAFVERRRGGETGVVAVQCLKGPAVWKAVDDGTVPGAVVDAVIEKVPKDPKRPLRGTDGAHAYLIEYADGFRGAVLMLPGARLTALGVTVKGDPKPQVTTFEERRDPRYPHFAFLLKGIESMVHSGRPAWPVERTLLTSGVLDRALTSLSQGGKRLETPELKIEYKPADWPCAPKPDLGTPPAQREG